MSGTGKSTILAMLAERGFRVVDTDERGWKVRDADEWIWDEERMSALLTSAEERLFVSGCVPNQGRFYDRFDAIVLLSAPADVILKRIASRTSNPYGKNEADRAAILADLAAVEPRLRATCTHELDAIVDALVAIAREPRR